MKLNMSMIEAYLEDYATESNIQSNARTIHGIRFLAEEGIDFSRDYVYIGLARDYFKDPRYSDALILGSGRSHIVCRGLEHAELINHTLSAFDYYNGLEHKLVMMAAEHAPVSDMAEVIGKLIRAPFLVFGIDGTYLGGAHLDALDDEELLRGIREHGGFDASIIGSNFADESGKAQHDLSTKPTISRGPKGQFAVNMYLHDGREAPGFIMCFPLQVQHTHLAFALEPMLAEYLVAAHEFVNGTSPHQALHLALADLLAGRDVSEDTIGNIRHSLGPTQRLSVVLVRSLLIVNQTQRLLLVREVSALLPDCIAAEIGDAVAFLVPHRQADALIAQVLERFEPANVAIGVSMPVVDIERAPMAMRQAEFACGDDPRPGVRYCKDLALPFLLRALRDEPSTQDLLHPALGILATYDHEHNAHLTETLKAYLDARYNQAEAAKRIHVHLNTLKYRIKRIQEVTALDFQNHADMLYLQLSFELQVRTVP